MVNSVESFLKINKDASSKITIIKSISNGFCETKKGMIGWVLTSKTEL